tara:strand:- start:142 stop:810 length:669 start_codon:yes stop_codon:yes gene_type:complete
MFDLTLALTVGVPLAILIYIVRSDKFPEPPQMVFKTFFIGVLITIPAGYLNSFISIFEDASGMQNMSFLAGFTEEPLKFLAFMLFVYSRADFDEPMDAIVYGTVISLGFATLENIEYVYLMYGDQSFQIAILRAISAIPLHASCGVIMGYYIGLYAFKGSNKYLIQALFIPIVVHSLYNFLTGFGFIFFGYLVGVVYFANTLHKKYVFEQQNKSAEYEERLK